LERTKSSEAAKGVAYREECDLAGDLMLSQGVPQTHHSVFEISRKIGIRQSSVGCIIHDLFRDTHTKENSLPIRLLMYPWVA